MQLLAVPVGAAAVSLIYPVLVKQYRLVDQVDPATGETLKAGLSSPISQKWAGFAKILEEGPGALPTSALYALIIFSVLGVVLTVMESNKRLKDKGAVADGRGHRDRGPVPRRVHDVRGRRDRVGLVEARSALERGVPRAAGLGADRGRGAHRRAGRDLPGRDLSGAEQAGQRARGRQPGDAGRSGEQGDAGPHIAGSRGATTARISRQASDERAARDERTSDGDERTSCGVDGR